MRHLLKKTAEERFRLTRRPASLAKEFLEQTILEKLGILRKQTKKDLVDEVGYLLRRMATSAKPSSKFSEARCGFRRHVGPFFDRPQCVGIREDVFENLEPFRVEELLKPDNDRGANEIVPVRVYFYAVSVACEKQWGFASAPA
jgi:hypothetical protein